MKKYFVTSDIHFSHNNIIKYCNRPFKDVEEMNRKIIENWNKTVCADDDVYIIGDLSMTHDKSMNDYNKLKYIISQLNGNLFLIKGNHDYLSDEDYIELGISKVLPLVFEFSLYNNQWVLCHYQMVSWNRSFKGAFHLFGHEHWRQQYEPNHIFYEKMKWSERKYNVCMDANNYTPIDFKYISNILLKRPINF